jgi:predicted regulator of Ras-like GTPase activity (Roadblock/LC7/MglB family)
MLRTLTGVLQALAGALVVGADAVVGAAAAPVTAGISIFGAAASGALGTDLFNRGTSRALA